MDELVKLIAQKAGISEPSARKAIEVILGYLHKKLPQPVYYQLENVITGGTTKDLSNSAGGLPK
jgi:hypothetical protein